MLGYSPVHNDDDTNHPSPHPETPACMYQERNTWRLMFSLLFVSGILLTVLVLGSDYGMEGGPDEWRELLEQLKKNADEINWLRSSIEHLEDGDGVAVPSLSPRPGGDGWCCGVVVLWWCCCCCCVVVGVVVVVVVVVVVLLRGIVLLCCGIVVLLCCCVVVLL